MQGISPHTARYTRLMLVAIFSIIFLAGCSDLREEIGTPESFPPLTYKDEIKSIFDNSCVVCHGATSPEADYDLSQYDSGAFGGVLGTGSDEVPNVIPGDENSLLIQTVDSQGSMRQYLGGGAADAAKIRQWVVDDNAREE